MNFVNLKGCAVSVEPVKQAKSSRPPVEAFHKGWDVVGFSPAQLAEAKLKHESDKGQDKVFEPVSFMRKSKPKKVRPRPYEVHEAAVLCAEMARRGGWLTVQVLPRAKGVR